MEGRVIRKSSCGYKAHVVEDESQIVTSVETIPGNENEGSEPNLERLLDKEAEKRLPAQGVTCDSLVRFSCPIASI